MATVQDILAFIETLAPVELKMDWDNVGLLCGRGDKEVRTILVALDPFPHVCDEAMAVGADLLITHHPLIFEGVKSVTDQTTIGQSLIKLIANDISAINAHTNLDCAQGGVNDTLAECLELTDISVIGNDRLLRVGNFKSSLEDFLKHIKTKLSCEGLRYVDGGKPVSRIAVGGGSCGSALPEVIAAGCDTFITADVKYNQFWDAKAFGINLIDAGHFQTENPVCAVLAKKLQTAFPQIHVILSKSHRDCMKFY